MSFCKLSFVSVLLAIGFLSGCATTDSGKTVKSAATLETAMAEVDAAQLAGQNDKVMALLTDATKSYPTEKAPWLRMAQIRFDHADYGPAIVDALEVLQRDPKDNVANSIIAVSGLRLSTKALADMQSQNGLSGSVKTEAQDLAKLLRESLGETVLVPAPVAKPAVAHTGSRHKKTARAASPKTEPRAEADAGNANPFGALK